MIEVAKEFTEPQELLTELRELRIEYTVEGAMVQIKPAGAHAGMVLLCANHANYKILYICAHLLAEQGTAVGVLHEREGLDGIVDLLENHYYREEEPKEDEEEEGE